VVARLPADGRRPLARKRDTLHALYRARQNAYRQAHLRLDADSLPAGALVERLMDWLGA
jgi:shikimate kinase